MLFKSLKTGVFSASELQADCVSLLALLRRGVCGAWRACVFSKALQSQDEAVRAAAVRAFPLLLHHLGNTHQNLISKTLLYVHVYVYTVCEHFNKNITSNTLFMV